MLKNNGKRRLLLALSLMMILSIFSLINAFAEENKPNNALRAITCGRCEYGYLTYIEREYRENAGTTRCDCDIQEAYRYNHKNYTIINETGYRCSYCSFTDIRQRSVGFRI
ncbi:hypothetical protein [Tissierella praeacuta]|uniref:hypothetical protein n=1 Tax=Tissierella praeacuta TaxID=43131 RepID=UPI00333E2521